MSGFVQRKVQIRDSNNSGAYLVGLISEILCDIIPFKVRSFIRHN